MQNQEEKKDLIFYVLPYQKVNLKAIPSYKIQQSQIQHDLTLQGTIQTLKYRQPLNYLGQKYVGIVVPCIPAKQPRYFGSYQENRQTDLRNVFLIKVPYETQYQGFASGKRSAIVQRQDKFLRLKGCGNLLEGFTIPSNEPKGCHYFHTLKRQLLMTRQINQILEKQLGVTSANIPQYAFEYKTEDILKLNLKCQGQMIAKYCCVFETLGDRRIGTHVISPLEILFLNLCNLNETDWFGMFEKNKRIDEGQPIEFVANWLFLQPGQKFLEELLKIDANQNYVALDMVDLKNIDQKEKEIFIQKILQKLIKSHQEKEYVKKYLMQSSQNMKEIIQVIVEKIGFEMGQIKRIFCDYEINWGYFNDHGSLWHCNAHLNNFISTIPKQNSQFLLPLDFDMAFFKKEYIRIDLDEDSQSMYGKLDQNQFENFLCSQYQAMQLSVSGIEVMSNFQYSINYDKDVKLKPTSPVKMARLVFRDSLLKTFRAGMRKDVSQKQRINKAWNQKLKQIKEVIKLCLIISQDFQT